MASGVDGTYEAGLELKARSQWSYARRRFLRHRLAMSGLIVLVLIFGTGIFANLAAPYSFEQIDLTNVLHGPTTVAHHFFGTDEIGRDFFSRVIFGIRTSMEVGVRVLAERWNESAPATQVGSAYLVFAAVDADGKPRAVPPVLPETERDERRYQEAQIRRTHRLARRRAIRELRERRGAAGLED